MGKRLRATQNSESSPFRFEFGNKIGSGQDNIVREFKSNEAAGLVVKISNQKGLDPETPEQVRLSAEYKKNKYEILKLFLGNFIPDSYFLVGDKKEGKRDPRRVPKSYTIQQRVPQFMIRDLTPEQRLDPRLLRNMYMLVRGLQQMYDALEIVNHVTADTDAAGALDGKLDLGGISKFAQSPESQDFDPVDTIQSFQDSPNLLVDPESMKLYCIDFDDGEWSPQKAAAKAVLFYIADESASLRQQIIT